MRMIKTSEFKKAIAPVDPFPRSLPYPGGEPKEDKVQVRGYGILKRDQIPGSIRHAADEAIRVLNDGKHSLGSLSKEVKSTEQFHELLTFINRILHLITDEVNEVKLLEDPQNEIPSPFNVEQMEAVDETLRIKTEALGIQEAFSWTPDYLKGRYMLMDVFWKAYFSPSV